ncbi:MAG TPA: putative zinc-binding metallopeptidase [Solirubrobacteraceae bacterium]|nr:putative zinc-binding metallopeptidase [Solirubrobacteraceae bacterium]
MRAFSCGNCGQLVFFENSLCLRCSHALGFVPERLELVVFDPNGDDRVRPCANSTLAACNWLLATNDPGSFCLSCGLTRTRPADADTAGLAAFAKAEMAKRRLIFQLLDLRLPIGGELSFDLLSSHTGPVVTGHDQGVITIDLAESNDARREQRRAELGEPYRTMLGHFRHEIGHYYWPLLVEQTGQLTAWRQLFGDEREDYQQALQRHYELGPPADWSERHVSAYATTHPWEDWAETFAHYLHIRDSLQTAAEFGLIVAGPAVTDDESLAALPQADTEEQPFNGVIEAWLPLTYALNAVNRSMGRDDLYPFTLAPAVIAKLAFVHQRVRSWSSAIGYLTRPH